MKFDRILLLLFLIILSETAHAQPWKAKWISTMENQNGPNTWIAYRKDVELSDIPSTLNARIAVDSKYWLWINGELVIREGGLKRGPNALDTYYDEVNISTHLRKGRNSISILVWYFGKDGFSHKSSGKAGLLFDCQQQEIQILSDASWQAGKMDCFATADAPLPNFRLSESSILYDARRNRGDWQTNDSARNWMSDAMVLGDAGDYPWNKLVLRPIPQWKDFGLKTYANQSAFPFPSSGDTISCDLPYNAQVNTWFDIEAEAGLKITVITDNYYPYNGGDVSLRSEYITRKGRQTFENPGWVNGHQVKYIIPKGVIVHSLQYRETGYDTEFAGSFESSDSFLNRLWQKSARTLYITMRDSYMDCPERERAQWTGDAVNESGEAFYALSPSSNALTRKWLKEIFDWQRKDSSLYSPVPAGNWDSELPSQVAATVGLYGLYNYYLHTADQTLLSEVYDRAKKYLYSWKLDKDGLAQLRRGGWSWGDWGEHIDLLPLTNLWYYLMLDGLKRTAIVLGRDADAHTFNTRMHQFARSFNKRFWNGSSYRDTSYHGRTDDRVQAMAVVSRIADRDKFPALLKVFMEEEHASPYMEKYVLEAMFIMRKENQALSRMRKRFSTMVDHPQFTTLWEGWGIGQDGFGGGTINHAWSGGGLTILSQYLCGISPITAGYKTFSVLPQPGNIRTASGTVSSVAGIIKCSFINQPGQFNLNVQVPKGTSALVGIPAKGVSSIRLNGRLIWRKGKLLNKEWAERVAIEGRIGLRVKEGAWTFVAK